MLRRLVLTTTLTIAGCAQAPSAGIHAAPQNPRFAPGGVASRVVLTSFDGLAADDVARFGPSFAYLAHQGTQVFRVIPVNPTVTSATHASILTGATPEHTGIVANRFHRPGTAPGQATLGLESAIEADTLVDAVHRAGKRVGAIAFPHLNSGHLRSDFGVAYSKPIVPARLVHLSRVDFHPDWLPPGWGKPAQPHASFSPIMRARLDWSVPQRTRQDVDLVAYDATDDGVANYDELVVETAAGESHLDDRGWFAVTSRVNGDVYASWSKLMKRDSSLNTVTLYWGSIARTEAFPESFRDALSAKQIYWPGQPDEESVRRRLDGGEGIDATTFAEQNDRFTAFLTRATLAAIAGMQFDLLLTYNPVLDIAQHQFLIRLDTQKQATAANRDDGERVRTSAFAAMDREINEMAAALDPARDALIVTGDHGVVAVDTEVRLGSLLQDWSFAPRWTAYAGGNLAELNRSGDPDDTDELVKRLTALRSPDGALVLERIERRSASSHPNSGDLILYSYSRFALSGNGGEPFAKPSYYGQHGGLHDHAELHTALVAWGRGVPAGSFAMIRQTQIARYVAELLDIEAPNAAE